MKKIIYFISLIVAISFSAGLQAENPANLDAASFASKMKQLPNSQIVDVRTPGEFSQGHIKYAQNMDISSRDFQQNATKLDKNKPVFVYCLSGSRSAYAANALSSMGFKEIYNLAGGMMRWRSANMPETTDNSTSTPASTGMTLVQYRALLNSNKLVLIDFYADWCVPCQKMKPYLNDISKDMKDKVVVVRIDAEANKMLAKELKVDALPVLYLYKGKKLVWSAKTYVTKEKLVKTLKSI